MIKEYFSREKWEADARKYKGNGLWRLWKEQRGPLTVYCLDIIEK